MPSDELMEAIRITKRFPRHEDCPKSVEPGSGLSGSPRQSDMGTAVILGPDDYHALLTIRDAMLSTRDETAIDEAFLLSLGFKPRDDEEEYFRIVAIERLSVSLDDIHGAYSWCWCGQPFNHPVKTRTQLMSLLEGLGIEVTATKEGG